MLSIDEAKQSDYRYLPPKSELYNPDLPIVTIIIDCYYKLNLVKTRLLHSDLTISQIANELGFSDESHLNRTFKKQMEMTAKQYRVLNTCRKRMTA